MHVDARRRNGQRMAVIPLRLHQTRTTRVCPQIRRKPPGAVSISRRRLHAGRDAAVTTGLPHQADVLGSHPGHRPDDPPSIIVP
jgi:hypothetical protein